MGTRSGRKSWSVWSDQKMICRNGGSGFGFPSAFGASVSESDPSWDYESGRRAAADLYGRASCLGGNHSRHLCGSFLEGSSHVLCHGCTERVSGNHGNHGYTHGCSENLGKDSFFSLRCGNGILIWNLRNGKREKFCRDIRVQQDEREREKDTVMTTWGHQRTTDEFLCDIFNKKAC